MQPWPEISRACRTSKRQSSESELTSRINSEKKERKTIQNQQKWNRLREPNIHNTNKDENIRCMHSQCVWTPCTKHVCGGFLGEYTGSLHGKKTRALSENTMFTWSTCDINPCSVQMVLLASLRALRCILGALVLLTPRHVN